MRVAGYSYNLAHGGGRLAQQRCQPRAGWLQRGGVRHAHTHSQSFIHAPKSVRLTLIGPPGSGKGTQSAKLERDFGLSSISTGQILRQFAQQETEAGLRIKEILAAGGLVEDDIMLGIIKDAIARETNGWIIDGYPRNPTQAEQLDYLLKEIQQPLSIVFYLDVPEEVLVERLLERWVHPSSGRTYNLTFSPPKVHGIDDVTGEPLVRRSDDNPDSIRRRLQTFHDATKPLVEYYKKTGLLIPVDSPTSDVGYVKIREVLNELTKPIHRQHC